MPAIYASPHTLTLVPSNPWPLSNLYTRPKERDIDRGILLGIAPDREVLFTSNKSIGELRQILKVRVGGTSSHWLYRSRKRANASLKSINTRVSTLIRGGPSTNGAQGSSSSSKNEIHILRRVLSASELAHAPSAQPKRIDGRLLSPYNHVDQSVDVWGTVRLSTADKLISPRPLGPTHILIVHSMPGPSRILQPVTRGGRKPLRPMKSSPLSNVVEIPINDLLFVLNVPNLAQTIPAFPPRLHKELPQVLIYVPHIETFHELVVYLHTQNQAELFRKLIPEWIRDLLHPLPEVRDASSYAVPPTADIKAIVRTPLQLLSLFIPASTSVSVVHTEAMAEYGPHRRHGYRRTRRSVAEEIARTAFSSSYEEQEVDPIVFSVTQLNALRDNLEYLGYFHEDLWHELDIYQEVLIMAVSCQAKIRGDMELRA